MISCDFDNSYKRYDETHILELYRGTNDEGLESLLLITPDRIPGSVLSKLESSEFIKVDYSKRSIDTRYALEFYLSDSTYSELFDKFAMDLAESSKKLAAESLGPVFLADRYCLWKLMFKKTRKGHLQEHEIKGLIGELSFMNKYLFGRYGLSEVVACWCGPEGLDQDFRFKDSWYEVKALNSGKPCVHVSSVEQLDTDSDGVLAVVRVDKTSPKDPKGITLNRLVEEIRQRLLGVDLSSFDERLLKYGYVSLNEYDSVHFRVSGIERYSINDASPVLRRVSIPETVSNIKYDLSLGLLPKSL